MTLQVNRQASTRQLMSTSLTVSIHAINCIARTSNLKHYSISDISLNVDCKQELFTLGRELGFS